MYDQAVYYEVERALIQLSHSYSVKLVKIDFTNLEEIKHVLEESNILFLFCDNPRNWWLDSLDINGISDLCSEKDVPLIVDTSVQPCQDTLAKGATIQVFSLGKYPSCGLTSGGAIVFKERSQISMTVAKKIQDFGSMLSPESSYAIWSHTLSLRDRLTAISQKTEKLVAWLKANRFVTSVRYPNSSLVDGNGGGQITFTVNSFEDAYVMERVVGENSFNDYFHLKLSCTFGAPFTTFEHFAANIRKREGIKREETNEASIPDTMIRLGVGYESLDNIIRSLNLAFESTHYKW